MIIDGMHLAQDMCRGLCNHVTHLSTRPHLTVFTCSPGSATKKYLHLIRKLASTVGIDCNVIELPDSVTTEEIRLSVLSALMQTDGVVLQLPFPEQFNMDVIMSSIPETYDVDSIHYAGAPDAVLPPKVASIAYIAAQYDVLLASQRVVIVGSGEHIENSIAQWARTQGARVTLVQPTADDFSSVVAGADILISHVGQPSLISPTMVREGVILFDFGAFGTADALVGDIDPACAEKASLYAPVPGGVDPIVVAHTLQNLLTLLMHRAED